MQSEFMNELFKFGPGGRSGKKNNSSFRLGRVSRQGTGSFSPRPRKLYDRQHCQRSIVKTTFTGNMKTLSRHVSYITRNGAGENGKAPELFTENDSKNPNTFVTKNSPEKRYFKMILSPEKGDSLDLKEHARELMAETEKALGRKLDWFAAIHKNTDQPHVHIVVRGLDQSGRDLRIPKAVLAYEMRSISQWIATRELGQRSDLEIAQQSSKEVSAERYTSIDRIIDRDAINGQHRAQNATQERRLSYLSKLGLATEVSRGVYRLEPDWASRLKSRGEENDFIKTLHKEYGADKRGLVVRAETNLTGVVIAKKIDEAREIYDQTYLIVRTDTGAHYRYANVAAGEYRTNDRIEVRNGIASKGLSKTNGEVQFHPVTKRTTLEGVVTFKEKTRWNEAGEAVERGFVEVSGVDGRIYRYHGPGQEEIDVGNRLEVSNGKVTVLGRDRGRQI